MGRRRANSSAHRKPFSNPDSRGKSRSLVPKADAIDDVRSGNYVVESRALDELSVNVYRDTAVVFNSQQEKSKYNGKENSGRYHFTNVWVKREGKWQVVASHGSRYGK